jgi:2-polyprenyl-3-methyl-5-hydroxy-6-metoxy-1,4-benzoquinol methylase
MHETRSKPISAERGMAITGPDAQAANHRPEAAEPACYLCGSATPETILSAGEFSVVRCRRCGLRFSYPFPSPETLLELNLKNRSCYLGQSGNRLRDYFKTKIMEANGGYPGAGIPETATASLLPRRFMPDVIRWIPDGKILDVGFGSGTMLDWLRDHGWETWGVDFARDAVERMSGKGHHIAVADIEKDDLNSLPRNYFDVIRLSHVLEHLSDPIGAVVRLRPLLKHRGLLIVSIPNLESTSAQALGRCCTMLNFPRHLYFFSPATVETVLARSGFEVIGRTGKDSLGMALGSLCKLRSSDGCIAAGRALARLVSNWLKPERLFDSYDLLTFLSRIADRRTGETEDV